ncbi:MAG: pilus biosynthesis protein TadE [Pirellulaceae bacterium]|nr:MAG: pilus biosynthesis protein TadE [Pirellulaceae bacterium]
MRHLSRVSRHGGATVEMAVVLPLLVTMVFGTIEVTNAIHLTQGLKIAAYEGARVALLPNADSSKVEHACRRILDARRIREATIEITPGNFPSKPYGTPITVTCSAPLSANLISPAIVLSDRVATGTVTMMKER